MAEYRNRTTGELKTKSQLIIDHPNMSLPKVWNDFTFDALDVDPVFLAAKPSEVGQYQQVIRNGVEQDANGKWVEAWQVVDMFSDTTEDGVTTTKAEHEAAYQTQLDNSAAERNRRERDRRIAETDWWASSDLTMTAEQTAHRQALRDITTHANWPHLGEDDWPTKP
jgi:hypothetical protein